MSARPEAFSTNLDELPTGSCVMTGVEAADKLQINIPDEPDDYAKAPIKLTVMPSAVYIRRIDMRPIQIVDRQSSQRELLRQPVSHIALKATTEPGAWEVITPGLKVTDEDSFGDFVEILAGIAKDKVAKNKYTFVDYR